MNVFIEDLKITNIDIQTYPNLPSRKDIHFYIGEIEYVLLTSKRVNEWTPSIIFHGDAAINCPLCENKKIVRCSALDREIYKLFDKVINHPSYKLLSLLS
jgi:hypothetical protein